MLLLPRGHPLARAKAVGIEQLAACRLLLPAAGTVTRIWVDSLLASEGLQALTAQGGPA